MRTLYVSYCGLREPLVQTQVLPYLRELVRGGVGVSLMTFEPRTGEGLTPAEADAWRSRLNSEKIQWCGQTYHKWPSVPATLFDVAVGAWASWRLMARHDIDVFHARGHIPGLMGAAVKRLRKITLLFDVRGFMPEEYTDAGVWPEGGVVYRVAKVAERQIVKASDGFVVLTDRAREVMFPGCADADALGRPIAVIPTCVDRRGRPGPGDASREAVRGQLGLSGRRVVIYVGSIGGSYGGEELAAFLGEARRQDPSTFAIVLTHSPTDRILGPLRRHGVPEADSLVCRVAPEEVARYLRASDVAVNLVRPGFSKLSMSPTKVAEYLACGLPVVHSAGIGDVDALLEGDRLGVLVHSFDADAYRAALEEVDVMRADPGLAGRCEHAAREYFDLESIAGERYRELYRRLGGASLTATV